MFIERIAPEELKIKVEFKFDPGDDFYKFVSYTVWVTLIFRDGRFEYKTRTTCGFPDRLFEAEVTRQAKKAALEVAAELMGY